MSNQQPQPQDSTPQRDCRIMRRIGAQRRESKDRIGEDGGEAKKRKDLQKSYIRDVENGGDSGGRRKKRKKGSIGSVDVDPEDIENRKKVGTKAQGAQGLKKNCRVCSLCRV